MFLAELASPKFTLHEVKPLPGGFTGLVMSNRKDDGFYDDYHGTEFTVDADGAQLKPLCAKSRSEVKLYRDVMLKAVKQLQDV